MGTLARHRLSGVTGLDAAATALESLARWVVVHALGLHRRAHVMKEVPFSTVVCVEVTDVFITGVWAI